MSTDDALSNLLRITGLDATAGVFYLESAGGSLEHAVELFFANLSGDGENGSFPSSSSSSTSSSTLSTTSSTTTSSNSFKVVTHVTHVSAWDPLHGKALLCIGTLSEYSTNDLYLMKTVPTFPNGSIELHDEFMVTFVDKQMTEANANEAYDKITEQKRVIKHVRAGGKMLETRMNGDVTRNFRMTGGLCEHDGLHVIVPSIDGEREGEVTKKESFEDQSLTIQNLFQKMHRHGCDYLVIIGRTKARWFPPVDLVDSSLRQPAASGEGETKSGSSGSSSSSGRLESVSKWTPPIHGGKVLIAFAHSSLGGDDAARQGYTMKDGEFMVSYTSPLSCALGKDADNAIDEMRETKSIPLRINSAFTARINGHWTPNYSLSMSGVNDPVNPKGYMGLWVLDPESRCMEQVEDWKELCPGGHRTTVKDLFTRMKREFDCDYLVVLGCKSGQGRAVTATTRKEMLRVVEVMKGYRSDATVQEWGMASIVGLKSRCKMKEEWEESERVIDAVFEGMREHGEVNAEVAKEGCDALSHLVGTNANNRNSIGEKGGIDMIVRMKSTWLSNSGVQTYANKALGSLC